MKYKIKGFKYHDCYKIIDNDIVNIKSTISLYGYHFDNEIKIEIILEFPNLNTSNGKLARIAVTMIEKGGISYLMKKDKKYMSFKKDEQFFIDINSLNKLEISNSHLKLSLKNKEVELMKCR